MLLQTIRVRQFRNFDEATLSFNTGLNLLIGKNGQGKTNLLEAIYFASMIRSCRISDAKACIQHGCDSASIDIKFSKSTSTHLARLIIHQQGKTIYTDHQLISKISSYIGSFVTVIFMPSMISIFDDSPSERRKMIDEEICKIDHNLLTELSTMNQMIKQRNTILKQFSIDQDYLSIVDDRLVASEQPIIEARHKFIQFINKRLGQYYQYIMHETSKINVEYRCCVSNLSSIKHDLLESMKQAYDNDVKYASTTIGAHREDFVFIKDGYPVKAIASQGQKRAIVLAFKLSVSDYIYHHCGEYPILLLDDVLSELDSENQQHLLKLFKQNQQTVVTTCQDEPWFNSVATCININKGQIL